MSKYVTQADLAEAAQVSEGEVKHLSKYLACEVLGIHPHEWIRLTIKYHAFFRRGRRKRNSEAT